MRSKSSSRSIPAFRCLVLLLVFCFSIFVGDTAYAIPTNYTVTFVENDTGTDSVTAFQIGSSAQDLTLFSNFSPAFSDPGYTFADWNTAANGSGTTYSDGENYSFTSDLVLYAQWDAIPTNYTVTFVENDSGHRHSDCDRNRYGSSAQDLTLFQPQSGNLSTRIHLRRLEHGQRWSGTSFSGWRGLRFQLRFGTLCPVGCV